MFIYAAIVCIGNLCQQSPYEATFQTLQQCKAFVAPYTRTHLDSPIKYRCFKMQVAVWTPAD